VVQFLVCLQVSRPSPVISTIIRLNGFYRIGFMATDIKELDAVLERLNSARDRDEYHRILCDLAPIAKRYVDRISARFHEDDFPKFNITWALIGSCDESAVVLFCHAIKDSDKYVRWAASEALSKCECEMAVAALVNALKDRSTLVKGVAVSSMKRLKPRSAASQLEKIVQSKHLQTHSPGIVSDASIALARIRNAE